MFSYKKSLFQAALLTGFFVLSAFRIQGQIASGGQFTLEQLAIASGGTSSSGGQFAVAGTSGQTVAGQTTTGASFSIHAGFWNQSAFAPTSAEVTVGGRVVNESGRGIARAQITMTDADGAVRYAQTNPFGYFRFADVPAGETYIFNAAKRYRFSEPTQVRTVSADTDDINFVAVGGGLRLF